MKYLRRAKIFLLTVALILMAMSAFCEDENEDSADSDSYEEYDPTKNDIVDEINTESPGLGDFLDDAMDIDAIIDEHQGDIDSYLEDL